MEGRDMSYYEDEYLPKMNRLGTCTGVMDVLLSFCPAACLALVYGLLPDWGALLTAFVAAASAFGILWFVEPISYFPILGPVGTYMAFLSGNISNMRVPCASMAQVAADVEPGTAQGSLVATIGMAVSVIINVSFLTIGVILGSSILSMLPQSVTTALNYLLPALFGALLMQFAMKQRSLGALMLVFGILVNIALRAGLFAWLPGSSNYLGTLSCVFVAIVISLSMQGNARSATKREGK